MGDLVKIGVKTGLVVAISAAIIAIFATLQLPVPDFTWLSISGGKILAIANYWNPLLIQLWNLCLILMTFRILIWVTKFGLIAVRWIMKVNE